MNTLAKAAAAAIFATAATTSVAHANPSEPIGPSDGHRVAAEVFASPNTQRAYTSLTRSERVAFDRVQRLNHIEVKVTTTKLGKNAGTTLTEKQTASLLAGQTRTAATGCWSLAVRSSGKALAGNTLFTYGQRTQVCASDGRVYHVAVPDAWNETSTPGWRIEKDPTTGTRNVGWEGRGRSQHYFVLGMRGFDIQHSTHCLQVRLNADFRHYFPSGSCDLG